MIIKRQNQCCFEKMMSLQNKEGQQPTQGTLHMPDHADVGAVVSKYQMVLLLSRCGKRLSVRVGITS